MAELEKEVIHQAKHVLTELFPLDAGQIKSASLKDKDFITIGSALKSAQERNSQSQKEKLNFDEAIKIIKKSREQKAAFDRRSQMIFDLRSIMRSFY